MKIIGPQNWPEDTSEQMLAWLGRVRVSPPRGGDLWLPQPDFQPLSAEQKTVRLVRPYAIELPPIGSKLDGWTLVSHGGYATDGASVPKLVQFLTSDPLDPQNLAPYGGCHDPLYGTHYLTREQSDQAAFWVAIANGNELEETARFRRWLRLCGWWAWMRTPAKIRAARQQVHLEVRP